MTRLIPLVSIVGPTSVGKSQLVMSIARSFHGEIVSADSRHVYRGLDIGTGKPSVEDRRFTPHHLVDVVEADEEFSVAHYKNAAADAIAAINGRGSLPFLVGGTGHYIRALLEGYRLPPVAPDPDLRSELASVAEKEGGRELLLRELGSLDPESASSIDPRNIRRVIRAIEVSRLAGRPFSELSVRQPPPYHLLTIGLTAPRLELYRRIDARVESMIAKGWEGEVRVLLARNVDERLPSMSSLGYVPMIAFIRGEVSYETTVHRIQLETHRFARRQYGWFKIADERIRWIDVTSGDYEGQASDMVREFVARTE